MASRPADGCCAQSRAAFSPASHPHAWRARGDRGLSDPHAPGPLSRRPAATQPALTYLNRAASAPRRRQVRVKDDLGASRRHAETGLRHTGSAPSPARVGVRRGRRLDVHGRAGRARVRGRRRDRGRPRGARADGAGRARRAADWASRADRFAAATCCSPPRPPARSLLIAAALLLDSRSRPARAGGASSPSPTAAHKPAQAALLPQLRTPTPAGANALWSAIDNGSFVAGAVAGGRDRRGRRRGGPRSRWRRSPSRSRPRSWRRIARDAPAGGDGASSPRRAGAARAASLGLRVGRPRPAAAPARRRAVGVDADRGHGGRARRRHRAAAVDLGDAGVGWLNAAWGVGGIAGAARFALRASAAPARPAACSSGCRWSRSPSSPTRRRAVLALTVLGVGYALVEVAGLTLLQRLADDGVRARAFAVVESSYWLTTGAGAMLAPAARRAGRAARRARARRRRPARGRARLRDRLEGARDPVGVDVQVRHRPDPPRPDHAHAHAVALESPRTAPRDRRPRRSRCWSRPRPGRASRRRSPPARRPARAAFA